MILLIGPRENIKNPSKTGGIIVAFEDLLNWYDQNNLKYIPIDTNKENYSNKLIAYVSILLSFVREIRKVNVVSLHGTYNDYLLIAPYVVLLSKIIQKKVSLRKFAGNFDRLYNSSNLLVKFILKTTLTYTDILFFETRHLVDFAKKFNENTYWFPNGRKADCKLIEPSPFRKKFVFISQVKDTKGVREICDIYNDLSEDYTLDIYGPILEDELTLNGREEVFNKIYKGRLKSDEVLSVLREYDVVVLPTYHEGEGYPGILIEAYSLNKPVITTIWNSIPEIVDNMKTGILIKPRDTEELYKAIAYFDQSNYKLFERNVTEYFKQFDRELIYDNFHKRLSN